MLGGSSDFGDVDDNGSEILSDSDSLSEEDNNDVDGVADSSDAVRGSE